MGNRRGGGGGEGRDAGPAGDHGLTRRSTRKDNLFFFFLTSHLAGWRWVHGTCWHSSAGDLEPVWRARRAHAEICEICEPCFPLLSTCDGQRLQGPGGAELPSCRSVSQ